MTSTYIFSIVDAPKGTHTTVRQMLNHELGGPDAWDYHKPLFSVYLTPEQLRPIFDRLATIEGVSPLTEQSTLSPVTFTSPVYPPDFAKRILRASPSRAGAHSWQHGHDKYTMLRTSQGGYAVLAEIGDAPVEHLLEGDDFRVVVRDLAQYVGQLRA